MSKLKFKLSVALVASASVFNGCFESSEEGKKPSETVVYVAVGNSLTAGYQSGGLREDWQKGSYPAVIAEQMGIDDFELPLIKAPGIGRTKIGGKNTIPLYMEGGTITTKVLDSTVSSLLLNSRLGRPYNNLGIPGMTTKDFLDAYDSLSSQSKNNGFFNIVLRGGVLGNTSALSQAILLKPTVMTMWVGNNDILGGITEGTVIEGVTVTPTAFYSALMNRAFDSLLTKTTAHIFLANIPSITTIPFVRTVPTWIPKPDFSGPAVDTATKFLTAEANVKYILVTALPLILGKHGVPTALGGLGDSLPANVTLTEAEAATAVKLTDEYNAYLKGKADAEARITLVDVNALLSKLFKGELPPLTGTYPLFDAAGNTAFSLDGIHPNAKGYKHVTNLFLETINSTLSKTYPLVP